MKLSLLIPIYNCASFLGNSLSSLLQDIDKDIELLISDDCSTDHSVEIIKSFQSDQITLFEQKKNLGYLKNMNFLFSQVKTDYIALLDADDWCDNDRFEKQLSFLQNNLEYDIVGTSTALTGPKGIIYRINHFPEKHEDFVKQISFSGVPMLQNTIMFHKKVLETIGGYREWFNRIGAEDADWIMRAVSAGFKVGNISNSFYYYRQHATSVTSLKRTEEHFIKYRQYSTQVAYFLYTQRQDREKDALERQNESEIDDFIQTMPRHQGSDPSIVIADKLITSYNTKTLLSFLKVAFNLTVINCLKFSLYLAYIRFIKMFILKNFYYRFKFRKTH